MFERQIYYFMHIMEHGMSFTKAAVALHISQPALSKHISLLENKLGVSLFDTSKRTAIKLTPAGKILLEHFLETNKKFTAVLAEAQRLDTLSCMQQVIRAEIPRNEVSEARAS
jgi:LysR family cyn operon transcriptional activator